MKSIEVVKLDKSNVRPYGALIAVEDESSIQKGFIWYGEMARMENSVTQFNLCDMYAHEMQLRDMEVHQRSKEALVVLGEQGIVLAMAPKGTWNDERIKAFYLAPGEGIVFDAGTYHSTPFPLEGKARMLVVFEANTGEKDNQQITLPEAIALDTRFLYM